MNKVDSEYNFKKYLSSKNAKITFLIAFIFSLYNAGRSDNFLLDFILECFIFGFAALGLLFVEYGIMKRKILKGEMIVLAGHEIKKTKYPKLFEIAKQDSNLLEQKIRRKADTECGGNLTLAIDLMEEECK